MENTFLPAGTKEPTKSNYYKFVDGANTFRVLAPAVVGWEYWTEEVVNGEKKNTPHRVSKEDVIPMDKVTTNKFGNLNVNYFWAFPVYDFVSEKIQILEITQASIRKGMLGYINNAKWGNPMAYNFEVTKTKVNDKTEYSVIAEPKEELDKEIVKKFNDMKLDMSVWMAGGDPFAPKGMMSKGEVEEVTEEIPF